MKSKYFSEKETFGLVDDLVYKLDRTRALYGHPIIITSGYRDPGQNIIAGGANDSAHVKGMAVDIRCSDHNLQKKLIFDLREAGIRRIGVYDLHIHADIDSTKPTPALWFGKSK